MDNRDLRVVEFDICDLETKGQHVPDGSGLISPVESAHDSLVFTVVETVVHSEPIGTLVDLVTFKRLDELHRIIWQLADCCPGSRFWIAAYLAQNEIPADMEVACEPQRRYGSRGASSVLVEVPFGHSLPITRWAGIGHMPGFRFMAVPAGGESDAALQQLARAPIEHPGAIEALCWNQESALWDACLEIRPFGDEDRDHVQIVLPRGLSRDWVRSLLARVYGVSYYIARLSLREFWLWEDEGKVENLRLSQWVDDVA